MSSFDLIWNKIQELALMFFNYAMNEGENNFMMVDYKLLYSSVSDEQMYFFMGSFVVMVLLAILACDSFQIFHPFQGMKEWKSKISIVKIVVFTAAVFSLHTFYKMLIGLAGHAMHADASVLVLDCLGTYINPISLMIYSVVVATITLRKRNVQMMFLGWATFLTPAVLSFSSFSKEHLTLYFVAIAFGIVGAILYKKKSLYSTCFVMYLTYFVAKFFMILYSEQVVLLTSETMLGKIGQYMACMQMDMILCVILLFVLMIYKEITADEETIKLRGDFVVAGIVLVILLGTVICNSTVNVYASEYIHAEVKFEKDIQESEVSEGEDVSVNDVPEKEAEYFVVTVGTCNIRTGPGTDNAVIKTAQSGDMFEGTGNSEVADNGSTWYEIYLDEDKEEIGWASEKVIQKQ